MAYHTRTFVLPAARAADVLGEFRQSPLRVPRLVYLHTFDSFARRAAVRVTRIFAVAVATVRGQRR